MIEFSQNHRGIQINFSGIINHKMPKDDIAKLYLTLKNSDTSEIFLDVNNISDFDISFIFLLLDFLDSARKNNKTAKISGDSAIALQIKENVEQIKLKQSQIQNEPKTPRALVKKMFDKSFEIYCVFVEFLNFLGYLFYWLFKLILNPRKIRINAINYHIFSGVITAMPVIFVVSFIVGGVIAYQGAATLERMGFMQVAVTMTAALTLREIGPFVVALIVAGRSASAYTAQIGVMKMTDELNAMKTMNFNLFNFIVLPRFIALVISFPLMVFLSDLVSIFGCMIFLHYGFDIAFGDYIMQLKHGVSINGFWTGIIKAPFYAATIAVIGCFVGFRVEDNTQSVGEKTTASVVYALFGVIVVNALFSLIFTELRF